MIYVMFGAISTQPIIVSQKALSVRIAHRPSTLPINCN